MECSHVSLTTAFARVKVSPSGPKPAGAVKRTSVAHSLPWAPDQTFGFKTTKPSLFYGHFKVGLSVEGPPEGLEACLWTEDKKGSLVGGQKGAQSAA